MAQNRGQQQNREHIENSLRLVRAEMELWMVKITTYNQLGRRERGFTQLIAENIFPQSTTGGEGGSIGREAAAAYCAAHKAHRDAEEQLMRLQYARLQSQVVIYESMLAESESVIKIPQN